MPAEQVGEFHGPAVLVLEVVVARLAAERQGAPLRGDALDVAPQVDFLGEQRGARAPVLVAVVGIGLARRGGEFGRGLQPGHRVLLRKWTKLPCSTGAVGLQRQARARRSVRSKSANRRS